MKRMAIVLGVMILVSAAATGQEISLPLGNYPASSYPLPSVSATGSDSKAYWPEPLPLLSTYPLTPSVQPLPQLYVPRLPAYGLVTLPQPITGNALTTFLLSGPFSTQVSFAGSLSWPVDRPFLVSRFDPVALTSHGGLRSLNAEPICRENVFSVKDALFPSFLRLR